MKERYTINLNFEIKNIYLLKLNYFIFTIN